MKRRLGLSIYPDHSIYSEDLEYIKYASNLGFSRVFMSMLEVSEGKAAVFTKFNRIINDCKNLGFEVILDIAPAIFEQLQISYDDLAFFHELGADGIRLDLGFDGNKEALLSYNPYNLIIELNMSNDVNYLNNILSHQANKPFIYGCHNFYPQNGTALPLDFFESCSIRFKKEGIRTAAFITSQAGKIGPWDVNDGLPTLEMHRTLPLNVQAKHLFATGLIDDVIIGNAYASIEELESLASINRYQLELTVDAISESEVAHEIMFNNQHVRRGDITSQVIRSTEMRKKYKEFDSPVWNNKDEYKLGDILIGNDNFGKYKNEMQITLEEHFDERKNKVGTIVENERFLLKYVLPWSKFKLVKR